MNALQNLDLITLGIASAALLINAWTWRHGRKVKITLLETPTHPLTDLGGFVPHGFIKIPDPAPSLRYDRNTAVRTCPDVGNLLLVDFGDESGACGDQDTSSGFEPEGKLYLVKEVTLDNGSILRIPAFFKKNRPDRDSKVASVRHFDGRNESVTSNDKFRSDSVTNVGSKCHVANVDPNDISPNYPDSVKNTQCSCHDSQAERHPLGPVHSDSTQIDTSSVTGDAA